MFSPGVLLDNEFRIISFPKKGGTSYVYRAVRVSDKKKVVIKVLNERLKNNKAQVLRFIHSEEIGLKLSHPRIIKYFPHPENSRLKYQVLEYVDGESLREKLVRYKKFPWRKAVNITLKILDAISYIHSKGIIHLDLKPENIIVLENGDIKIIDFGISYDPKAKTSPWMDALKISGTPGYYPPERVEGVISKSIDIYSIGVILYEMLSGGLPDRINLPDDVPKGIRKVVKKAINLSPGVRFKSCSEFANALVSAAKESIEKESSERYHINYFLIFIFILIGIFAYILLKITFVLKE